MKKNEIVEVTQTDEGLYIKLNEPIPFKWKREGDHYFLPFSAEKKPRTMEEIQKEHPNAYKPWSKEEDDRLEVLFSEGKKASEIAEVLGRMKGAVYSRIKKLELREIYN
ncbi:MAG: hypothetical protein ACFHU9_00060 [Fluviicola sp.]